MLNLIWWAVIEAKNLTLRHQLCSAATVAKVTRARSRLHLWRVIQTAASRHGHS
jgi:hypothetical protein